MDKGRLTSGIHLLNVSIIFSSNSYSLSLNVPTSCWISATTSISGGSLILYQELSVFSLATATLWSITFVHAQHSTNEDKDLTLFFLSHVCKRLRFLATSNARCWPYYRASLIDMICNLIFLCWAYEAGICWWVWWALGCQGICRGLGAFLSFLAELCRSLWILSDVKL